MNRRKIVLPVALFLAVGGGALLYHHFHKGEDSNVLTLYGNVDVRQVEIGFRVGGQVDQLFFQEGDVVKVGDLMALLDQSPYLEEVTKALSNVEALAVDLENAERQYERRLALVGELAVSQEDCDNAKAKRDQLIANLIHAEGELLIAQDELSYIEARAPSDGIILSRIREPGTVVNPTDPVYALSVTNPIWVRAFVDEPHLGDVYYGMKARVRTDRSLGKTYQGTVGFISPMAEFTPKTVQTTSLRTDLVYRLRVYIDDPDEHLIQGMPVTVELLKQVDDSQN